MNSKISILVIYTGGTIGMVKNPKTGSLTPFDFDHIIKQIPELNKFGFILKSITLDEIVDSSNITPRIWVHIAKIIEQNYNKFDGFVVLHGTDTMAYSASALSFMLENLSKPVVFTGAQLPIGTLRTDGKENFISAIEIAAAHKDGKPIVPEVTIFFENMLYRGTRTTKHNADYFDAFRSHNYPELAKAGINITYNIADIHYPNKEQELKIHTSLNANIAILKIFPGITPNVLDGYLHINGLKGLILESYGSGNATSELWFTDKISEMVKKGVIIISVTQCSAGSVDMGAYETSLGLIEAGVYSGYDITTEAALAKLMFLLGQDYNKKEINEFLTTSIRGEISI